MEHREIDKAPHQATHLIEAWLTSPDRDLVDTAVTCILDKAVHSVLPKIAKHFSATECAEIISSALKNRATDPNEIQGITKWVEDFKAGKFDTIQITEIDLGTWSRPPLSQGEKP